MFCIPSSQLVSHAILCRGLPTVKFKQLKMHIALKSTKIVCNQRKVAIRLVLGFLALSSLTSRADNVRGNPNILIILDKELSDYPVFGGVNFMRLCSYLKSSRSVKEQDT